MTSANSLVAMFRESVEQHGNRSALMDPNAVGGYDSWSYAEAWHDIQRVATKLMDLGVEPGDRIGLISETRAAWPIVDLAIMSTAAVTVPIYPSLPANQVEFIVAHAGMKGIFVQNGKQLKKLLSASVEAFPDLEFVACVENGDSDLKVEAAARWKVRSLEDWRRCDLTRTEEWEQRWTRLDRSDLATVVYTSGTTGTPKGVMLTHGNLLANLEGIQQVVQLLPADETLSYLPLSHIFERTAGQFFPLSAGACIFYSRGFEKIADDFASVRPTVLTTVPRLLEKVLEQVESKIESGTPWRQRLFRKAVLAGTRARVEHQPVSRWKLSLYDRLVFRKIRGATGGRLRMVVAGGAALPPYVGRFFTASGFRIVEGYGMTETSPVIAVNPLEAPRIGTVGRVLANVEAQIAADGELMVRGPSITAGYYHDEQATQEALTEDGWLHTGDIAEFTDDGYLRITDRKKHLLVLSTGKKVTPNPIESEIVSDPMVDQALLLGQDRKYVSVLVVPSLPQLTTWYASSHAGQALPEEWWRNEDVREFLLSRVRERTKSFANFEQPKQIVLAREPFTVENRQLTPTLKVRTRNVLNDYAQQIDALYGENTGEFAAKQVMAESSNGRSVVPGETVTH